MNTLQNKYTKEQIISIAKKELQRSPFDATFLSLGLVFLYTNKKIVPEFNKFVLLQPSVFINFGYVDLDLNITDNFKRLISDADLIYPDKSGDCATKLCTLLFGLHLTYKYVEIKA